MNEAAAWSGEKALRSSTHPSASATSAPEGIASSPSGRDIVDLSCEPVEIDRRGRQQVLTVRLGQAEMATAA